MFDTDDFNGMSDEELIEDSRAGNGAAADALLRRYMPMVRKEAKPLYLKGADEEDLIQEGMLGLFQALRDYDANEGASFKTFAALCVRRQLLSAVEAASRRKHEPLNTAVSYDVPDSPDTGGRAALPDEARLSSVQLSSRADSNPEEAYISEESVRQLLEALRRDLSPLEREVLDMSLGGMHYRDIAKRLDRGPKSIDNALQRIKMKLRRLQDSDEMKGS